MDDIIDELLKGTNKRLIGIEEMLYKILFEHLSDNLSITDNRIEFSSSNIKLIERLNSLGDRFGTALKKLTDYIVSGISNIIGLTSKDLSQYGKSRSTDRIIKTLTDHAATSINKNISLEYIFADIKQSALNLMSKPEGISLRQLRETLKDKIETNGIARQYYSRWTYDIYSQYQRVGANEIRKEIGLKFAFYQGGLIESSRPFCEQRNGKVYSESEIMSWEFLDFKGKPEIGYSPIADLGGYNCRHRLDWISDELAKVYRPDLFE